MQRRNVLQAASIALLLPGISLAQQAAPALSDPAAPQPYDLITPEVKADAKTIRLLFAYECSFCRQYHNGITEWGKTLPSSFKFEATPILNSNDDTAILAVFGRRIVEIVSPQNVGRYDFLMFERIQDHVGQMDTSAMLKLIVETGTSPAELKSFLESDKIKEIEEQIPEHAKLIEKFGLTATPTVSIAGKMRVTPDHAQGDPQKFAMLLNGIISRLIEGGRNA